MAEWLNMLIIAKFWNILLFNSTSSELDSIINRIEKYLKNVGHFDSEYKVTATNTRS